MNESAAAIDDRAMRWAWMLGLAGLIPFVAQAIVTAMVAPPFNRVLVSSQIHYAALILVFVGGVHWGIVLVAGVRLSNAQIALRLIWGVVPSLYAFWFVQITHPQPLLFLAGGLVVAFIVDWFLYGVVAGHDLRRFRPVRALLTTVATLSLLATWWLVRRNGG